VKEHWEYFKYVFRHKRLVGRECLRLGLYWAAIFHDWHKFLPDEWFSYVDFFYRGRTDAAGAAAYNAAFNRHIQRSRHHWQSWVLLDFDLSISPIPIPERHKREMLADWLGMAAALGNHPGVWYWENRDRLILHEWSRSWFDSRIPRP